MRFIVFIVFILILCGNVYAADEIDYSKYNLLPQNFLFNNSSSNINLSTIKTNDNTSISFGVNTSLKEWNMCSGRLTLNTMCPDSQFTQSFGQTFIGPQVNFKTYSAEGGFESSISYTTSKNIPLLSSQKVSNMDNLKLRSSVNLNLSDNSQIKFIGEYKKNTIQTSPDNIINNLPKNEFGVGLKLNIGF